MASALSLADDLIAFATVRGDAAGREQWLAARTHLAESASSSHEPTGPALSDDITRAVSSLKTSGWVLREQAIAELPFDLRWLFEAGALTAAQLEVVVTRLGALTVADLRDLADSGRIAATESLGADVERAIAEALPAVRRHVAPVPLGRALEIAEPLLARLRAQPGVQWAEPTGSLRRGHELIGDIDLIACTEDPARALRTVAADEAIDRIAHHSSERAAMIVGRVQVTVGCYPGPRAAARLLWSSGSHAHIEQLRSLARERRMHLDADGLGPLDAGRRAFDTEAALYEALGLPWIPPELRRGDREIPLARSGALPDLIERGDMLGDLHMHSQWSDGRDSVDAMVRAAIALGYRYIAITDHSPSSSAIRNLQLDDVSRQADEIAALRERFPQIAILHGCEVDILADGTLDFPDKVLRRFDIVLASLHDRAGQSGQQLLRRYLSAMVHPLVTIITHPTNRLFPRREGYDLDYDRLFEAAVETRTVLEIDGAASHLDLNADLAARAAACGVTLAIDSDAHAANQLDRHMQAGLLTARRAGVERQLVLNARPLPQIRALIAAKRSRVRG